MRPELAAAKRRVASDSGSRYSAGQSGQIQMSGLTGPIEFDSYGRRKTFILDLVELTQNGVEQVSVGVV